MQELDITTIIFLALAVFVIWRLRSVLGQKTGHEKPPTDPFRREGAPPRPAPARATENADNVVRLPGAGPERMYQNPERWKGFAQPGSSVAQGLDELVRQDPEFNVRAFVDGAKMAYEMVVTAFAMGDRKTLKSLLSKEVYEGFEQAITDRERRGERAETTFVAIDSAEIVGVEIKNRVAQITLRFASELITATRDSSGKVVDGSPETVVDVTDIWTFARTIGDRNPNWTLIATEAGQ